MNKEQEKQAKAGNPLFVLIILVALVGFLYVIPEVYKRYNKDIANFLGVGENNEELEKEREEEKEENIEPKSGFYLTTIKSSFHYNEFEIGDASIDNGVMTLRLRTENTVDLKDKNYYVEFYENQSKFLGRRRLNGIVTKEMQASLDVSSLPITVTTYFQISHISDDGIPNVEIKKNDSNIPELICSKGNSAYSYEFSDKKLTKVTYKYNYTNADMNAYSEELIEFQKKEREYSELTGVTSNLVENGNNFLFTGVFEYDKVKNFSRIGDNLLFEKDKQDNVVKFRMESEGYECQ